MSKTGGIQTTIEPVTLRFSRPGWYKGMAVAQNGLHYLGFAERIKAAVSMNGQ